MDTQKFEEYTNSQREIETLNTIKSNGLVTSISPSSTGLRRRIKSLTFGATILGLLGLNVASLLSETIHNLEFRLVKAAFSSVMSNDRLAALLSESPTVRRKGDVAFATRAISEERAAVLASKKALEAEHIALKKTNEEIKGKHAELTRLTQVRSTAVRNVSKRLATRTVANAARNSSSIFAESIPYVGVAVVLGVTALDLHDACETLKDMNELGNAFDQPPEDATKVCGIKVPTKADVIAKAKSGWRATYETASNALKKEGIQLSPAAESQ